MRGVIIGNGTSRRDFDLHRLDGKAITVGCNRLYMDYTPDYLVAIDVDIRQELMTVERPFKWISREYLGRHCFITIDGRPTCAMRDLNHGHNNNSGVLGAAFLSEKLRCEEVYMIGVDFFRPVPEGSNDLYSPTTICSSAFPKVWSQLARNNQHTRFIRVGPIHDRDRDFYDNELEGFEFISFEESPF